MGDSCCEVRKSECASRQRRVAGGFLTFASEHQDRLRADGDSGFQVTQRAPDTEDCEWCLLCRNGMEIMLNAQYERDERPGRRDSARATAHGDTAFYVGCRDLDAAYLRLCAQGVSVEAPVVTHYGMKQLMLRDPDGYGVCLQWRAA